MKKLLVPVVLIFAMASHAQDFKETLLRTYQEFESTDSVARKMQLVNRLDLIASKWSDQWTAHFYSAYAKTVVSYLMTEEKHRDAILEQADQALLKAISLGQGETEETLVLQAYIANARLAVKPMARYKKYGDIFDNKLEAASKLNPNNPRIYYLKGLSTYHTPKAFGGGASRALSFFEKASSFFSKEQQQDLSKPFWGKRMNAYYLHECKNSK
jgi:hypothetical protein